MAIKTFTTGEVLTAADTNTYLANSGLVYIAGATFSGITTSAPLDVNSVFSSTYTNYLLLVRVAVTVANGSSMLLRMRTVAAQENGAVYNYGWGGAYVSAGPTYNFGGYSVSNPFAPDTSLFGGVSPGIGYSGTASINIFSPNATRNTRFGGQGFTDYTGTLYNNALTGAGEVATATAYTGFRLFPSTGTGSYTGEYALYGYRIA